MDKDLMVAQTKKWIVDVVIGCNFCPFALREVKRDSLYFKVIDGNRNVVLQVLSAMFSRMNEAAEMETVFLIVPQNFAKFPDYLKLVEASNARLKKEGYEGVYQLATFHPSYLFAGSKPNDPANYTNRSPYPMLQILREESVSRAVDNYPDTHKIPGNNLAFARAKGLAYMQSLRTACLVTNE